MVLLFSVLREHGVDKCSILLLGKSVYKRQKAKLLHKISDKTLNLHK